MFQADNEAWLELCEAYLNELDYTKAAFCLEELILISPHNHVYHQRYADVSCLNHCILQLVICFFVCYRSNTLKVITKQLKAIIHMH